MIGVGEVRAGVELMVQGDLAGVSSGGVHDAEGRVFRLAPGRLVEGKPSGRAGQRRLVENQELVAVHSCASGPGAICVWPGANA